MASQEQNMPFIRNLASSDRKLRTQALTSLQTFLGSHRALSHLEALKLWKGLFYAMWMCDRPIPQQNLASELAGLTACLRNDDVPTWLAAFWEILSKQWTDIDVLRMEKFLLLVRRTFTSGLQWVKEGEYQEARVDALLKVYGEWPFELEGDLRKVPIGLRLHGLDIWVDELDRLEMLEEKDAKAVAFAKKLSQLVEPLRKSPVKTVRAKAAVVVEDERLPWTENKATEEAEAADGDDDEWGGIDDQ
ncbi:nucleolar protein,Nop52 [Colletotrichum paranaense]|uniref:Nucleolar protein,Nop52 n=3 Tax=Colletotrichum acutatum species complex TaxID=2707335 RepID=A0AAI9XX28_9PEZI|nr:nucleolar protein,Nop52 [Colletotrichum paranaense]XP_060383738.1 nucleolar protein,Nop52 [Colletotrichum tamarilloi]KAI3538251.1 nucleolar protein,Nop52 [Colletotrichum filicis]KAK1463919.1 nucleolar protein,Nop52 [Colletotrichum melonis]KAK1502056.1 nucleolar protein,Nop52 [Colletotrichum tamarilloi]KAK1535719.1 nucleolar protein,Nop52 [Colletotrichum paranaense]